MRGSRLLLKTAAGKAALISLIISTAYVLWLFTFKADPGTEKWVSLFVLDFSYLLFIIFGIRMLRQHPLEPRLRRSWLLLIVATISIFIAELIFVLNGRPALSAA